MSRLLCRGTPALPRPAAQHGRHPLHAQVLPVPQDHNGPCLGGSVASAPSTTIRGARLHRALREPVGEHLCGALRAFVGQRGVHQRARSVGAHGVAPPDLAPGDEHFRQRGLHKIPCGMPVAAEQERRPPQLRRGGSRRTECPVLDRPPQRQGPTPNPRLTSGYFSARAYRWAAERDVRAGLRRWSQGVRGQRDRQWRGLDGCPQGISGLGRRAVGHGNGFCRAPGRAPDGARVSGQQGLSWLPGTLRRPPGARAPGAG